MSTIPKTFDKDKPRFKKNPNDFFVTPDELALACLQELTFVIQDDIPQNNPNILDVGCGTGVWGKAARLTHPLAQLTGIDIVHRPEVDLTAIYDLAYLGDYLNPLTLGESTKYNLIVGNPPYSSATNSHLAEDIVLASLDRLTDNGYLGLLLKSEFKASDRRYKNIFYNHSPLFEYQCVQRPNWANYKKGSNTIEYSFFVWGKEVNYVTSVRWLNWR